MLRRLRRSVRLMSPFAIVIAAMVVVGTADWWHADDEDASQPAFHDHGAHNLVLRSQKLTPSGTAEHCYLCHWLRTLNNGLRTVSLHRLPSAAARQFQPSNHARPGDLVAAIVPARAPPA